ncbi:MAG: glycosyl hydrolase family 8 [Ramlibacter sp.]
MQRRFFLLSSSAAAALALTGCGGGGDADEAFAAAADPLRARKKRTTTTTAPTTDTTTTTTDTTTTTPATGTATPTAAAAYPFGARLAAYKAGIKPTQSASTMDTLLKNHYDAWKAHAIVPAGSIAAGGYAVQFSNTTYMTVSEGMGYGMLLAVLFAGHDPKARELFDGLLAVVRARPAYAIVPFDPNGKWLMDWRLNANGSSAGEGWNAVDGDLDIAMALLMADRQWGSAGTWNYLQEGRNTIAAIKSWNMWDDGTIKGLRNPENNRTSDYMIGHFRAFKAATGDTLWDKAVDRAYWLLDRMQTVYSPGVGLMPDFVINTNTSTPSPSTGYIGDGNDKEGFFWWNACRNPWRFASDYLLSGDARFQLVTSRMIDFFKASSGGDPLRIGTGYDLDGRMLTGGNSPAYHGPICAGACVDARFQGFLDTMWNWNASHMTTGYYDGEIQLLSMIVASGNWWTPGAPAGGTPVVTEPTTTDTTDTTAPATSANIVANGDFAGGMTGWQNWGNSVVVAGALQVGSAAGGVGQNISGKATAGAKYQFSATANITTAAEGVFVGVKVLDSAGAVLLEQVKVVSSLTPAAVSIAFTAPQGAAGFQVYVWKNQNAAIGVVDNVSLTAVA